ITATAVPASPASLPADVGRKVGPTNNDLPSGDHETSIPGETGASQRTCDCPEARSTRCGCHTRSRSSVDRSFVRARSSFCTMGCVYASQCFGGEVTDQSTMASPLAGENSIGNQPSSALIDTPPAESLIVLPRPTKRRVISLCALTRPRNSPLSTLNASAL